MSDVKQKRSQRCKTQATQLQNVANVYRVSQRCLIIKQHTYHKNPKYIKFKLNIRIYNESVIFHQCVQRPIPQHVSIGIIIQNTYNKAFRFTQSHKHGYIMKNAAYINSNNNVQ